MFGNEDLVRIHKNRAGLIGNFVILSFVLILARLWYLQVYKGKLLLRYSLQNRLRKEVVEAPRGMMYSRNNILIVDNIPRFDAVIIPQYLKNKKITLEKLSTILDMELSQIYKIISKNSDRARYKPVIIKKNISKTEVAIIETELLNLPGVNIETNISREYRAKDMGAHLFGYISEISKKQLPKYKRFGQHQYKLGDNIGQFGIEEKLDDILRGKDGDEYVEVDARGRKKRHISKDNLFKGIKNKPSVPGHNLRLTIDLELQKAMYHALGNKVGAAVAVDVRNGEILAMVSTPSFNPTSFSKGITTDYWKSLINNPNHPMRDRTIREHYSPGSTFKTITALAALEEKIIDEDFSVNCTGKFRLGRRTFHCWKRYGHGKTHVRKALRESCDTFFYKIATKLDIDILAKYARMFGFGSKTGVDLPREISGLVPTKEWKRRRTGEDWVMGETLSCAIGQSYVLATPIQLTMAYAAIANGGTLFRPKLIKEIFNNSGLIKRSYDDSVIAKSNFKRKNLNIIRNALHEVVNHRKGTAWWQKGSGIHMAGKTGTSQVVRFSAEKIFGRCEEYDYKYRHHGIFVGYAPSDSPKIAVGVVIEHGCHGSSAAGPIAKEVITKFMQLYYPEKHKKIKNVEAMERKALAKLKMESEEVRDTL